jgi:hypothetical protein
MSVKSESLRNIKSVLNKFANRRLNDEYIELCQKDLIMLGEVFDENSRTFDHIELDGEEWSFLDCLDTYLIKLLEYCCSKHVNLFSDDDYLSESDLQTIKLLTFVLSKLADLQYKNKHMFLFNLKLFQNKRLLKLFVIIFNQLEVMVTSTTNHASIDQIIENIMNLLSEASENIMISKKIWRQMGLDDALKELSNLQHLNINLNKRDEILIALNQRTFNEFVCSIEKSIENVKEFVNNKQNYFDLFYVQLLFYNIYSFNLDVINYKALEKHNLYQFFLETLKHFYEIHNELELSNQVEFDIPSTSPNLNELRISILHYLLLFLNYLMIGSIRLNLKFAKRELIELVLKFLNNKKFVLDLLAHKQRHLLLNFFKFIYFISKYSELNANEWAELDAVNSLLELMRFLQESKENTKDLKEYCYYSLVYLADFKKKPEILEELNDSCSYILENLLNDLRYISNTIVKESNYQTINKEYIFDDKIVKYRVSDIKGPIASITLMLIRLLINKRNREKIGKHLDTLRIIIFNANDLEKYYTLQLLAKLCEDDQTADLVLNDKRFYNHIKSLING